MPSTAEIEDIIRAVVERLREVSPARVVEQSSHQTRLVTVDNQSVNDTPQSDASLLNLELSLVTLENLRDKLGDVRVLQVPARAVVTPAVLDELRSRKITLQRVAPDNGTPAASISQRLLVVAAPTKLSASMAARSLAEPKQLDSTLNALVEHTSTENRLAIWCTTRPFEALVATKPIAEIRAVQLGTLGDFENALEQAHPNVLILDERMWTTAAINNLARLCMGIKK